MDSIQVEKLRQKCPTLDIEVDGGLSTDNIETAAKAGANVIVAGTSIFKAADTKGTIEALRGPVQKHVTGQ
jgi:ribulose-phosphate 3-epimerase